MTRNGSLYVHGHDKNSDGTLKSYMDYSAGRDHDTKSIWHQAGCKLLSEYIVPCTCCNGLPDQKGLKADEIDYFLLT